MHEEIVARSSGPQPALVWVPATLLLAASFACTPSSGESEEGCVSTERYFLNEVWRPLMSSNCIQCHSVDGQAKATKLILKSSAESGYLEHNLRVVRDVASFERDGESILLLKPTARIDHGGGQRISPDGAEYLALAGLVDRFEHPVSCLDEGDGAFFTSVVMRTDVEVLRRVALNIAGRLPTASEIDRVSTGGETALEDVLTEMMNEEGFHARLREIYNDQLLTDRYYRGSDALNLLDEDDHPGRRWYEPVLDEELRGELRDLSNAAVAREPLNLITHVVKNDRPFTEILTADYLLVNDFSARVYGLEGYADGTDPGGYDPGALREARISGVPHAGLLTTSVFLNRFPTTPTNVNRHRARMVFSFFLATDVLKLAERPVDPTQIEDFNPTMYNPGCNVCHAVIDPVAGAFQNWDERGRYRPPENGWHESMRPPGLGDATIPHEQRFESLRWLAARIAGDERFATSAVYTVYRALTGQEPLTEGAGDPAQIRAFDAQDEVFRRIRERFVADGYNLKSVIKALAASPYLRAGNAGELPSERLIELSDLGSARLLTPEQLDRKIRAVLGYPWLRYGRSNLLSTSEFRIFYGGIDSDTITKRITEPSGVMASVQARMAAEMSCLAVPQDFAKPAVERLLFPSVEASYVPEDDNGFEIPGASEAIRDNIRHLHAHVLGEDAAAEEVERTYGLFAETWREGRAGIAAEQVSRDLHWSCRATRDPVTEQELPEDRHVTRDDAYTIRAWMAVMDYLLRDYDFLYE